MSALKYSSLELKLASRSLKRAGDLWLGAQSADGKGLTVMREGRDEVETVESCLLCADVMVEGEGGEHMTESDGWMSVLALSGGGMV